VVCQFIIDFNWGKIIFIRQQEDNGQCVRVFTQLSNNNSNLSKRDERKSSFLQPFRMSALILLEVVLGVERKEGFSTKLEQAGPVRPWEGNLISINIE
jgi:hypothetical protein